MEIKMKKFNSKNEQGSFILELMIGLFMSAITILGVMFVYANFEGQKRTTTQLGQTIAGAAIALYPLQEHIKMAGYGSSSEIAATGCTNIKAFDSTKTPTDYNITPLLKPVDIIAGADNKTSDKIIISYGIATTSTVTKTPVKLSQNNNGGNADFHVYNSAAISIGDMILSYDTANPGTCALMQITNINGGGNNVVHNSGLSQYNKPGGLGVSIAKDTGYLLSINMNGISKDLSFQITNNQLTKTDNIYDDGRTAVIGDNIVLMKVMAGVDLNADGVIDATEWKNNLVSTDYQKIRGVKVALLARSSLKEKKDSSAGACVITTNSNFAWDNGTVGGGIMDVSGLPDWRCYRYRILETTIPIKNLLWPNS